MSNKKIGNLITENEIRPDFLRARMARAVKMDIRRLNGKREGFINVVCPACGSDSKRLKFNKYGMSFVDCRKCLTFYTNPRPTPDILDWFYKDSITYNFWNKYVFPASEKARRKKIFAPRVDLVLGLCKKFGVSKDSLLEIGAGHGTFCQEMMSRKAFNRVVAVEPVVSLAETCNRKGIDTINSTIENIKFKKNELFDVAVNFEVMEHLFSPKEFILHCKKSLKRGGLFIFTLPNGLGFDIGVLGKLSDTVDHEHLNYFNPKSIGLLLQSCGFELVNVSTPGRLDAELVRKKVLSGEFSLPNGSFLKQLLIDNWESDGPDFQKFLAEHSLSSHMMVVAKKKGM